MKKTNKGILFFIISIAVFISDQIIKFLVKNSMNPGESIPLIKNIFHLTYVRNSGAGFGIFQGQTMFLIWFAVIVIGIIIFNYEKIIKEKLFQISSALILGGTVSNLIDRIFLGFVVDYIDFRIWPVFNIADSCITIGALILIICLMKQEK
jgi:signal peptidase II